MTDDEFRRLYYTPEQWHGYRTNWDTDATPYSGPVEKTRKYRAPNYAVELARANRFKRNAILKKERFDKLKKIEDNLPWNKWFLPKNRFGTFRQRLEKWGNIITPYNEPKKWNYYSKNEIFDTWNSLTSYEKAKVLRLQKAKENHLKWKGVAKKKLTDKMLSWRKNMKSVNEKRYKRK